jgi:SAM-dependent methyltransferase
MKRTIQKIFHLLGYEVVALSTLNEILSRNARLQERIEDAERALREPLAALPLSPTVEAEFAATGSGTAALERLIRRYTFHTVLDIGAGSQLHSKVFANHGKAVTAVDFGRSIYHRHRIEQEHGGITEVLGNFNEISFDGQFDCIWASHVLEHQLDVDVFLRKIVSLLKDQGVLAITVPPLKHEIVGGHVSLWNAGLLLYRLVLAGLDCSQAQVLAYDYNISVIVQKKIISDMPELEFDAGDIRKLRPYLPAAIKFGRTEFDDPFDGNLHALNW